MSSGERKRSRPNRSRVIGSSRCASGVVGRCCALLEGGWDSDKAVCEPRAVEYAAGEGDGPVGEGARPVLWRSQVARDSWNPA